MGMRRVRITKEASQKLLVFLNDLDVQLSDSPSYDAVFSLAERHGLTIYDAAYLDLALREGLPLASLDNALCRAAGNSGVVLFELWFPFRGTATPGVQRRAVASRSTPLYLSV
jgi:predicted nucleic acid-binding protein